MTLADAIIGARLQVVRVDLERDTAAWLGSVGLEAGEEVVVLRRAVFGGPLHVRTGAGGEFAIGRDVARHVVVSAR